MLSPTAGNFADREFSIAQHSVDAGGNLVKRVAATACRQPLAQITGHDMLNFSVEFRDSKVNTLAQNHSDENRHDKCRQQAQREGAHDDLCNFGDLVDLPANHKTFPSWERALGEAHFLHLTTATIDANDLSVGRDVGVRPDGRTSMLPAMRLPSTPKRPAILMC